MAYYWTKVRTNKPGFTPKTEAAPTQSHSSSSEIPTHLSNCNPAWTFLSLLLRFLWPASISRCLSECLCLGTKVSCLPLFYAGDSG